MASLPLETMGADAIDRLEASTLAQETLQKMVSWALGMTDRHLANQLNFLNNACNIINSLIQLFKISTGGGTTEISKELVVALSTLRATHNGFALHFESQRGLFEMPPDSPYHSTALHGLVHPASFVGAIAKEAVRIQKHFGDQWQADLAKLCSSIESGCPPWEVKKDTLLCDEKLVRQMLDNGAYGQLGGWAGKVKAALALVKQLHKDRAGRGAKRRWRK